MKGQLERYNVHPGESSFTELNMAVIKDVYVSAVNVTICHLSVMRLKRKEKLSPYVEIKKFAIWKPKT